LNHNKKKAIFSINYITNFKPNFTQFNEKSVIFNSQNNNKIVNRSFFLFLMSIKFLKKKNNFSKNTIFVKKQIKHVQTILRPPYRFKLSRHQLILNRYYLIHHIEYCFYNYIYLNNFFELIDFIKNLRFFYLWFESNIVFQYKVLFYFYFSFFKNFQLKNF
jgi:hypothetical protein